MPSGWVHIKKRKLHGSNNTNLYTLDINALERLYQKDIISNEDGESASPGSEPISPNLVNEMHPINNPNKEPDIKNHKAGHTSVAFEDYIEEHCRSRDTINVEAAAYFVKQYKRVLGKEHKRMKPEVWDRAINQILDAYSMESGEAESSCECDLEEIRGLIDCYFMKIDKFEQPCDFSLPHFNSPNIKGILNHEQWRY